MPEKNWRRSRERVRFRRKCSGQFNIERTRWRSASAGRFLVYLLYGFLKFDNERMSEYFMEQGLVFNNHMVYNGKNMEENRDDNI